MCYNGKSTLVVVFSTAAADVAAPAAAGTAVNDVCLRRIDS